MTHAPEDTTIGEIVVVGDGRMGRALVAALRDAGADVQGPRARGEDACGAAIVLLAVPDAAIRAAAQVIAPGPLVGHLSGAEQLAVLSPHEGFSIHPLMTVTAQGADFSGVSAAIDGTTDRARATAEQLARAMRMTPFRVAPGDRAAYHAAASIASNFAVTLETFAEDLAATAGVPREALVPLVRASIENWAAMGADALTGPVARRDEATVARQRAAVAERLPERLDLFDALVATTRELAK
ncbi:DUF2520 domain-containing protein [Microbacterium aoyamense]|uniref:DUF2520 domain-containing protein n=1 Tax=Microbacterium aoyamense TaxID=344166 RepID=A0ABN2Q1Q4_9MICO|nr:Rossmann-like and DUF2520 domain-containing protein [Microbacterium aoyamense]